MALAVLLCAILGLALLAYGLSQVYGPLGFITIGAGFLSASLLQARGLRR